MRPSLSPHPVPSYNLWWELDMRWMAVAWVMMKPDGMFREGWMDRAGKAQGWGQRTLTGVLAVSRWNQSHGPGWLFRGLEFCTKDGTSYTSFGAQCEMKCQDSCFKIIKKFTVVTSEHQTKHVGQMHCPTLMKLTLTTGNQASLLDVKHSQADQIKKVFKKDQGRDLPVCSG